MTSVVAQSNSSLSRCTAWLVLGADLGGRRAMAALKVTYKDPHQLKPRARNPRTHTAKQIKQIAASMKEFGFISPILIDGVDGVIADMAGPRQQNSSA